MSITSLSIQLTSFITQISFYNQKFKIWIIGKVVEEYLQTKPHTLSFLFFMHLLSDKKFALAAKHITILSRAAKNKNNIDNSFYIQPLNISLILNI